MAFRFETCRIESGPEIHPPGEATGTARDTDGSKLAERIGIWIADPEQAYSDPRQVERIEDLLDDEERENYRRFRFEKSARLYLTAHALLRVSLCRFTGDLCDPAEWRFKRNHYGHPQIEQPDAPGLNFSLSYTQGLAACAVARGCSLGLDVERTNHGNTYTELQRDVLTPSERCAIDTLPSQQRGTRFIEHWTLKEAYAKALGLGLSLPINKVGFSIDGDGKIRLAARDSAGDSADWEFLRCSPTVHHTLALAVLREAPRCQGQDA